MIALASQTLAQYDTEMRVYSCAKIIDFTTETIVIVVCLTEQLKNAQHIARILGIDPDAISEHVFMIESTNDLSFEEAQAKHAHYIKKIS